MFFTSRLRLALVFCCAFLLFSCSSKKENSANSADVVVIGAGGAGLTAATELAIHGARVIVLEKTGRAGGNTRFATGGINASETSVQKRLGINDSNELNFEDTMKGGYNLNDASLVKTLVDKSGETVDWLISIGADLSDVGKMAGSSVSRTHRPKGGGAIGMHLIPVLQDTALKSGAEIRLNNCAVDILSSKGRVSGVKVLSDGRTYKISSKAVVVATGGFGANKLMVEKYNFRCVGYDTTNIPGTTGDAFAMVKKFDAALVDMDKIQIFPTVAVFDKSLVTEALRGNGAILVNKMGKRFANEMSTRDVLSALVSQQVGGTVFLIFTQNIRNSLKACETYFDKNLVLSGESAELLAENLRIPQKTFCQTIELYNEYIRDENDFEFGRKRSDMPCELSTPPFYAIEVMPAVHYTIGGLKINEDAQVINTDGEAIPGLFASGEVTGGVHGGNRLGGNAVADTVVFGKIAADSALRYVKSLEE